MQFSSESYWLLRRNVMLTKKTLHESVRQIIRAASPGGRFSVEVARRLMAQLAIQLSHVNDHVTGGDGSEDTHDFGDMFYAEYEALSIRVGRVAARDRKTVAMEDAVGVERKEES